MNNESDQDSTDSSRIKKVVDRSAAYPSITIEAAVALIQAVVKIFPKEGSLVTRTDIAAVLKKPSAATVQRDVSSCAQYGLLGKHKDGGYTITQSSKLLSNLFIPDKERRKLLLECFKAPKLYKELIQAFDNHAVPNELPYILGRNHEIADKAAPEAASIFIQNATYCGLLQDGILRVDDVQANGVPYADVIDPEKPNGTVIDVTQHHQNLLPPPQIPNQEQEQIKLGKDRNVFILYPDNISRKELEIVRRHLAIIEFRITETETV